MRLLKACPKGNFWENLLKQETAKEVQLVPKQISYEHNILYELPTNMKTKQQTAGRRTAPQTKFITATSVNSQDAKETNIP
jgi:hypothetical protein